MTKTNSISDSTGEQPDIRILERIINIDTEFEKLRLDFPTEGENRKEIVVDRKDITSPGRLVKLSNFGLNIYNGNARDYVEYINQYLSENLSDIPKTQCTDKLGWTSERRFAPYAAGIAVEADDGLRKLRESVQTTGSFDEWLDTIRNVRRGTVESRIILASSFSSVLIGPLNSLPFVTHLWGPSETGKTVALRVAASVWANPQMGCYIHSFNSTAAGRERMCSFLNSLPLIQDELQVARASGQSNFDRDIYTLTEGVGRTKAGRGAGIGMSQTWSNCIITSGEEPITNDESMGGALNRVIEIECTSGLFEDPAQVVRSISMNYGHAGRRFVEFLSSPEGFDHANVLFNDFQCQLRQKKVTDKQALSAAVLLAADRLATDWIFMDGQSLKVSDIIPYLRTTNEISVYQRIFESLKTWVVENPHRFDTTTGITCGSIENNRVYFIRRAFDGFCEENGIRSKSLLSWLKTRNLITLPANGKGNTVSKRLNDRICECVVFNLPQGMMSKESISLVSYNLRDVFTSAEYPSS